MTLKRFLPLALALATAVPSFSQVQLFEAEVSGVVPYVGYKWNQSISEYLVGGEYTIDGRTTLGFNYARPIKDTLTFDPELKTYSINPYGIFEFIEPDNLKTFSFAIRADLIHEDSWKNNASKDDSLKLNNFSRTAIGGGPVFALRIFSSDKLVMIPTAAYEFFYTTYRRTKLVQGGVQGVFDDGTYIWHDFVGSCPFHFILNEFDGLTFEPKITLKLGEGRTTNDLLNVSASFGYVRSF